MDISSENKIDMIIQSIAVINSAIDKIAQEQLQLNNKIDKLKESNQESISDLNEKFTDSLDNLKLELTGQIADSDSKVSQCVEELTNLSIFISSLQNQISEVVEYVSGEPYRALLADINKSLDNNQNVLTNVVTSLDENVLLCVEYFRNSIQVMQQQNSLLSNLQLEIKQSIDELIVKASSMTDASIGLKNVVTESASLVTAIESAVLSITGLVQTTVDKIQTIQGNISDMNELSRNILSSVKFENTASQIIESVRDLTIAGNQFKKLFSREEEKI